MAATLAIAGALAGCAAPPEPPAPPATSAAPPPAVHATPDASLQRLAPAQQRLVERLTQGEPNRAARSASMRPATVPMPLPRAPSPAITWRIDGRTYTLDDYLRRQPVMALLIAKDGAIVYERYQFGRTASHRYLSNSIAKSFTGLAMGLAQAEGLIPDFDATVRRYVPELASTEWADVTLRNLMRMGAGMRFVENYRPDDDSTQFRQAMQRAGIVRAAAMFAERAVPQGTRFSYSGPQPAILSAVLRAASGQGISRFLETRLWQAIGAEGEARWELDRTGLELTQCCLTALPRDYLRLGIVLAYDGRRPDTGAQVLPLPYLLDSTDWRRVDPPFRPGAIAGGLGYSNYFWLEDSSARRFVMLGVAGQSIHVDPGQRLVMVHLAANATPMAGETSMARERAALWRGVVQHAGSW